ncbi:MAG: recombination directionality factor [Roseateles sp.]|uniref:recombination directionality factor n=1 Tax=Roseateles sp. TaxID=1971397 RepID=UPI0040367E39
MLKGLAITPPVIGRISIGKAVERNGKRLPEKDDEFTLTSQVQNKDGWVLHPQDALLRKETSKLRSIPVRLLFNDPALNFRANYTWFDRASGRPLCVGDGETCRRTTLSGIQVMPCPTPDGCEASGGHCKPFGRLNVSVGDDDELGTFVFRTTGYNSIRTLASKLGLFSAVSGGLLSALPLELRLRGKSTSMSHRTPFYYVDITVRTGSTLNEAIASARELAETRAAVGFDQAALDDAARQGLANGAFEESAEEGLDIVDEFHPEEGQGDDVVSQEHSRSPGLSRKLHEKVERLSKQAAQSPSNVSAS